MTILFYLSLYIIGLICTLPLSKKVPLWFLASTGFVWGILLWMFLSQVILFLGIPFHWLSMGLLLAPFLGAALYFNYKNKTYILKIHQWFLVIGSVIGVAGLSFLLTRSSYIYTSTDSFNYIYHGKILAKSGLVPWTIDNFTKIGAFSSIIQMNSQLLPGEYLSGYQTLLGIILALVLFIAAWELLKRDFHPVISLIISGVMILVLASNTFLNHAFYIHNNLPAAVFLFLSLYSFWHSYNNEAVEWIILGMLAIIGFSFTRIEGPLYAIAILLLVISIKPQEYKRTLSIVLPYTIVALFWHIFLLINVTQNEQLSQTNLMLIIGALGALTILALVSKWIPSLIEILPAGILGTMFLGLILAILVEPEHMILSLTHFWQNLVNVYYWSWTWLIIAAILPFMLIKKGSHPENHLLLYSSAVYILIVLLLVLARIPYRLGQTDSSNRLMLQILPVLLFAIASNSENLKKWFFSNNKI